jgi:hypothetical protein
MQAARGDDWHARQLAETEAWPIRWKARPLPKKPEKAVGP